jgi:hypothetical protein
MMPTGPDPNSPRVLDSLAVLYTFHEGSGLTLHDSSGVDPAFDLTLDNLVTNNWVDGGGIEITGPSLITTPDVAEKMFVDCVTANAVSLEVWMEPKDTVQQATVLTYSKANENVRNVALYQDGTRYHADVLQSSTDPMQMNGTIASIGSPMDDVMPAAQHVVYTRDATSMNLYVNGVDVNPPPTMPQDPPPPPPTPTDQNDWQPAAQLALGNETNYGRPFLGKIYLAAVYCKKLTAAEVQKNFSAGH